MERIIIGADHAGFSLKEKIKAVLAENFDVRDVGPTTLTPGDDYPSIAHSVCEELLATPDAYGILICDTGIGMSIAANRLKGIRAAVVTSTFMAERSRAHNHANVLCLGAALLPDDMNEALVHTWLATPISTESRHVHRVDQLDMLG